jgi:uncharacterized coiled-coil protein SlyX
VASEPKLVVALEARLTQFEKQLKEAGVIADREVKAIEDRFSRANPAFGGTFLGSFLGSLSAQVPRQIISFVESLIDRFKDLERVSKLANIQMNDLFGLQEAAGKSRVAVDEVNKSVRQLAILLDESKRGEENSLSRLFDANPQALKGLNRDALTLQQTLGVVADIVQNARTEVQKIDLAKAAGQSEAMIPFLERGGAAVTQLAKAASEAAPDLQKLSNQAKQFDDAWNEAVKNVKAYIVGDLVDGARAKILELINLIISLGTVFSSGVFKGGLLDAPAAEAVQKWTAVRDAIVAAKQAAEAGPAKTSTFAERFNAVNGTQTRDPSRPLSNVPTKTVSGGGFGSDRFENRVENIERRAAALTAEAEALNKGLGEAGTQAARVKAELEALAKQMSDTGEITKEQQAKIDAVSAAYGRAAQAIENARSPLATFARESADISKQLNAFAARGLDNLTSGLADIVTGAKSAEEAFKQLAKSILNDLARIAIRSAITGPIAGALGGLFGGKIGSNANGTDYWGGGLTWVGEKGPELINLPRGSQVIPNDVARQGVGGVSLVSNPNIVINGPGVTMSDVQAAIAQRDRQLIKDVNRALPGRLARQQKLGT